MDECARATNVEAVLQLRIGEERGASRGSTRDSTWDVGVQSTHNDVIPAVGRLVIQACLGASGSLGADDPLERTPSPCDLPRGGRGYSVAPRCGLLS